MPRKQNEPIIHLAHKKREYRVANLSKDRTRLEDISPSMSYTEIKGEIATRVQYFLKTNGSVLVIDDDAKKAYRYKSGGNGKIVRTILY